MITLSSLLLSSLIIINITFGYFNGFFSGKKSVIFTVYLNFTKGFNNTLKQSLFYINILVHNN
ncbi:hypothetical protein EMIT036CA2_20043 [Chryseobacterium sp. IT-36CA2]